MFVLECPEIAKCPQCGTRVAQSASFLSNSVFRIEAYTCPNCKKRFHVTAYTVDI